MDQNKTNNIIVLTGFGPFRQYTSNPSWEAVSLIDDKKFEEKIVKVNIPVVYNLVDDIVEQIWNDYKPTLVIHCGVSCLAKGINLEKRAVINLERYCKPDICNYLPRSGSACFTCLNYLCCNLNLELIRDEINNNYNSKKVKLQSFLSESAGEFLCEYIYRCSLQKNLDRTLFVHVPELNDNLTAKDIADCLEIVIENCLKQLKNRYK